MIRTCVITKNKQVIYDQSLKNIRNSDVAWYWVDFSDPDPEEIKLLSGFFHFHPLTIEDCLEFVQRPKLDFYSHYIFVVLHSLHQSDLEEDEVDLFVSQQFIVSFHKKSVRGLNNTWARIKKEEFLQKSPFHIMYAIIDKIVDDYFPPIYTIEDTLNRIEDNTKDQTINEIMEEVFEIRGDLSKLRRTIIPMRDLLYRIIHSERISNVGEQKLYFHDIYDHLLKLVEMIEANREITADIRDSYLSINSNRMNTIMMTLTVITTIFMPLTFIVGLYGMNFEYMPELRWHYGYFVILMIMALIAFAMFFWFKKKGWFRFHKGNRL